MLGTSVTRSKQRGRWELLRALETDGSIAQWVVPRHALMLPPRVGGDTSTYIPPRRPRDALGDVNSDIRISDLLSQECRGRARSGMQNRTYRPTRVQAYNEQGVDLRGGACAPGWRSGLSSAILAQPLQGSGNQRRTDPGICRRGYYHHHKEFRLPVSFPGDWYGGLTTQQTPRDVPLYGVRPPSKKPIRRRVIGTLGMRVT